MNKNLFKALLVLGIVGFISLMTAFSCDKGGGDNAGNNSGGSGSGSGSGSGGGGGGGGGTTADGCTTGGKGTNICVDTPDVDVAQQVADGTIQLKVSGFPQTVVNTDIANTDISVVKTAAAANFKKAFDLTIKVDGVAAKEGLVLVGPGNLANANAFSISQGVDKGLADYKTAGSDLKEGIVSEAATNADDTVGGILKTGWNIITPFMSAAAANANADATPFAFTASTGTFPTKPILFCRTTLSAVTGDAAVQATTKLTGGQTASCYIGALGNNFSGKAADDWLKTAASANFKKKFNIAIAGIKTDGKTIAGNTGIGLSGADDNANIGKFKNGIDTTEMKEIADANAYAYRKIAVEVVAGTFMYTAPTEATIEFSFDDTSVAEMVGGVIQLKASGLPAAVSANLASDINIVKSAATAGFKKAFDIRIAGGTGGLVLVGPGNLANANAFSISQGVDKGLADYTAAGSDLKEGIVSVAAANAASANNFLPAGWNIVSPFMSTAAANADPNASPFAFSASTSSTFPTRPILFCRTTLSAVTSATVLASMQLTGGQIATCYVGVLGKDFKDKAGDDWLKTTVANFKKKFNIAIAGVKTDTKTINDIGLTATDKVAAFKDGISTAEMGQITAINSSKYTNIAVEVVRGALATYTAPADGTITFENFDTSVAEMVGGVIQLKADGFPTAVGAITGTDVTAFKTAATDKFKRAFDITITAGGNKATEGLVIVGPGNLASTNDFSVDGVNKNIATYNANELREGIRSDAAKATVNGAFPAGWNIITPFMSVAAANADPNASPFAFTASTTSTFPTKPILFCKTTITTITDGAATGNGTAQADTKLTGGQKATCYVGALGKDFTNLAAGNGWLKTAPSANFKKKFSIAVAAIKTDGKSIDNIGLTDPNTAVAFRDGISTAEMGQIAAANHSAYRKVEVEVVRGGLADYSKPATGTIKFDNFTTDIARPVGTDTNTIELLADGFPTGVVDANVNRYVSVVAGAGAANFKHAFDITIESSGTDATEGLVIVGPGSLANVNSFSVGQGVDQGFANYSATNQQEGIVSQAETTAGAFLKAGWNIVTPFMNHYVPHEIVTGNPANSPFAFTASTSAVSPTRPILVCRTTVTPATSAAAVTATTRLTGSQKASCYVGVLGNAFVTQAANDWLNITANDTFKKEFDITVAGIKTDGKTIGGAGNNGIGLPGADDAAKVANFRDGIDTAELTELAKFNSSAFREVRVKVVRNNFIYTPLAQVYKFSNFDTDVRTNAVGTDITIQIKAQAFPAVAANANLTASFNDLKTSVPANSLKPIFDVILSDTHGSDATAGITFFGPGNYTALTDFGGSGNGYVNDLPANAKEGYFDGQGTNAAVGGGEVQPVGWSTYGVFMNDTAPTANNPDASPFAFTPTTGANASQPFLFCRSTVTTQQSIYRSVGATYAGGQKARCYIGSKGTAFNDATNPQAATWLGTAASATFKKTFNFTMSTIRTDAAGNDSPNIPDTGFRTFTVAHLNGFMANFQTHFKKFSVEIVDNNAW